MKSSAPTKSSPAVTRCATLKFSVALNRRVQEPICVSACVHIIQGCSKRTYRGSVAAHMTTCPYKPHTCACGEVSVKRLAR